METSPTATRQTGPAGAAARAGLEAEQATISATLVRLAQAEPGLDFGLGPADQAKRLAEAESELGYRLPDDVRALYLLHDGQDAAAPGLLGGMSLLGLDDAMAEWRDWRSGSGEAAWFPLSRDGGGNNLGVDCTGGPGSTRGQFFSFGRHQSAVHVYAASLTAFLVRVAELAEAGRGVVDPAGPRVEWGIDQAGSPWPAIDNFRPSPPRDPEADIAWFAALEPAWQQRVGAPERAAELLDATTFCSPAGDTALAQVSTLAPLGLCRNLRTLVIRSRVLGELAELPSLPRLTSLTVATASHRGIDRLPELRSYRALAAGTPADLGPLSLLPELRGLHLERVHPALAPLQDCARLEALSLPVGDVVQFEEVSRLRWLQVLEADFSELAEPLDELDWRGLAELRRLDLVASTIDSLSFLDRLPHLSHVSVSGMTGTDVSGVGRMPSVRSVTFTASREVSHVAEIAEAATLTSFAGSAEEVAVLSALRPDVACSVVGADAGS